MDPLQRRREDEPVLGESQLHPVTEELSRGIEQRTGRGQGPQHAADAVVGDRVDAVDAGEGRPVEHPPVAVERLGADGRRSLAGQRRAIGGRCGGVAVGQDDRDGRAAADLHAYARTIRPGRGCRGDLGVHGRRDTEPAQGAHVLEAGHRPSRHGLAGGVGGQLQQGGHGDDGEPVGGFGPVVGLEVDAVVADVRHRLQGELPPGPAGGRRDRGRSGLGCSGLAGLGAGERGCRAGLGAGERGCRAGRGTCGCGRRAPRVGHTPYGVLRLVEHRVQGRQQYRAVDGGPRTAGAEGERRRLAVEAHERRTQVEPQSAGLGGSGARRRPVRGHGRRHPRGAGRGRAALQQSFPVRLQTLRPQRRCQAAQLGNPLTRGGARGDGQMALTVEGVPHKAGEAARAQLDEAAHPLGIQP